MSWLGNGLQRGAAASRKSPGATSVRSVNYSTSPTRNFERHGGVFDASSGLVE